VVSTAMLYYCRGGRESGNCQPPARVHYGLHLRLLLVPGPESMEIYDYGSGNEE